MYVCGIFAVFLVFYYCIKIDTTFGCGTVIVFMIFLFALSRERSLLYFGIGGSFVSLIFHFIVIGNRTGLNLSMSSVVRTVILFLLVPFSAVLIDRIVKAWDFPMFWKTRIFPKSTSIR